jgi:hypothetical protein
MSKIRQVAIAELSIGQRSFPELPDGGSPESTCFSKKGRKLLGSHLRERGSDAFINKFLDGFCRAYLSCRRSFFTRKEISAARGWDKLITLGCVFIAVPLAVFAPEHFGGPMGVPEMVPSWMPAHLFLAYFVGCALLAAATSLTVRKFVRLSSTLLGLMFFLFVCMMPIPNALADPKNRFAWAYALRDLSFAGGAWALAGLHSRASSPQ